MTRFLCHVPYDSNPNLKAGSASSLSSGARLVLAGSAQLYFHYAEINHFILRDDVQSAAVDGYNNLGRAIYVGEWVSCKQG